MHAHRAAVVMVATTLLVTGPLAGAADTTPRPVPARAERIRAEVEARYAVTPGRRPRVTEASSTGVVASLTLLSDRLPEPRVVPAGNGVYFAICPARAACPYPAQNAAETIAAFRPRRLALELALRTFAETTADLVVVALPTRRPVLLVLERADATTVGRAEAAALLTGRPGLQTPELTALVDASTSARLYVPAGLVSVSASEDTFLLRRVPGGLQRAV